VVTGFRNRLSYMTRTKCTRRRAFASDRSDGRIWLGIDFQTEPAITTIQAFPV